MTYQQVINLIKSGKRVLFNSSYYPVGYDEHINELFIVSKNNNHSHYLTISDLKHLTVE